MACKVCKNDEHELEQLLSPYITLYSR